MFILLFFYLYATLEMQRLSTQITVAHSGFENADDLTALEEFSSLDSINAVRLVGKEATSDLQFGSTMLEILEKELPKDDMTFNSGKLSSIPTSETHEANISREACCTQERFFEWCCLGDLDKGERTGCGKLAMEELNKQDYDPLTSVSPHSSHMLQKNIQQLELSPDEELQVNLSCDQNLISFSPFVIAQREVSLEDDTIFQGQFEQTILLHHSSDSSLNNKQDCSAGYIVTTAISATDVAQMASSTANIKTTAVSREGVSKGLLRTDSPRSVYFPTNSERHNSQHSAHVSNSIQQAADEARIGDVYSKTIQSSNSGNRAPRMYKTYSLPTQNSLSIRNRKGSSVKRQIRRAVRKVMSGRGEQKASTGIGKRGAKQLAEGIPSATFNVQHSEETLHLTEEVSSRRRESSIRSSDDPENCIFDQSPVAAKPTCTLPAPSAIKLTVSNGRVGKPKSAENGRIKSVSYCPGPCLKSSKETFVD